MKKIKRNVIKVRIDVSLNQINSNQIVVKNKYEQTTKFAIRRAFPRMLEYQRLELSTLVDGSKPEDLRISTKTLRWLIRDSLKHPFFMAKSIFNTWQLEITEIESDELPLRILTLIPESKIWVSRHSIKAGLVPSNLDESLEYDRLRNPTQFSLLVRNARNNYNFEESKLYRNENFHFYLSTNPNIKNFSTEFEEFAHAEIVHGRLALANSQVLQVSNTRKELIRRYPGYLNQNNENLKVLNTHKEIRPVENAIFFGSNQNWFHFIVEGLTRYIAVPDKLRSGIPIILEKDVHPNIIEICRLLSGVQPVLVGPFESLKVGHLLLAREVGVDNSIDSSPRTELLLQIRQKLLTEVKLRKNPAQEGRDFYFLRKNKLFRPLQNEREIRKCLKARNFEFVYPEDNTLESLILMLESARTIVIESGAAITNLMFAPIGLNVVELNPGDGGYGFWEKFLKPFEVNHYGIVGNKRVIGKKGLAVDGYTVEASLLVNILEKIEVQGRHSTPDRL
jgi:hypothetical protein